MKCIGEVKFKTSISQVLRGLTSSEHMVDWKIIWIHDFLLLEKKNGR